MVLTDYFDEALCINLLKRDDRWEQFIKEADTHSLSIGFWSAIDGNKLDYAGPLKKGIIGCAMSHRNIIQSAQEAGLKSILILEDDVEFDPELNEKFTEWIKEVPDDWDMLYLGGNHNAKTITKCSDHLMRCTNTYTTHAYAVKNTIYDLILDHLQNIDKELDIIYADIQKQCNAYCFTPRLAWQREGYSDVLDQNVNYGFLRDNDGCH